MAVLNLGIKKVVGFSDANDMLNKIITLIEEGANPYGVGPDGKSLYDQVNDEMKQAIDQAYNARQALNGIEPEPKRKRNKHL